MRTIRKFISALCALALLAASSAPAYAATPTATSFSTTVPANRQSVIQLQGADADGTALTFATLSAPSHGALSNLNASTGTLVYTPTAGYTGADSFTYKVTSGGEDSSTATVTISVSNAKTTVADTLTDASGNPRQGKVTFILTQPVQTPAGITPAGTSVSASLSSSGAFTAQLYPSRGMNPQAYYQVWFADSASLNRELLGVYDVPASTTPVSLSAYKVTDTNLAARYVFASVAALEAMSKAVANATVGELVGLSLPAGRLLRWDGAALGGSAASDDGSTLSVAGAVSAGTVTAGAVTASGTVTAARFVGNGAGITNVGVGTSTGHSAPGSVTIHGDNDADGSGRVAVMTGGVERLGVEADGTVNVTGSLNAGASFPAQFLSSPQFWGQQRAANNPKIAVSGAGDLSIEQYHPGPVRVPNGDIWVYVKGSSKLYAYKSTDNGATFALQNGGAAVVEHAGLFAVEPTAALDGSTVHLYYKYGSGTTWNIGHATCPAATPQTCTKDPANPILTSAGVQASLGLAGAITDMSVSSVTKVGSTIYLHGFLVEGTAGTDARFRVWYASGAAYDALSAQGVALSLGSGSYAGTARGLSVPTVFKHPLSPVWTMIVSDGSQLQNADVTTFRRLVVATAPAITGPWTLHEPHGLLLDPTGTGWESRQAYGAQMLKSLEGAPLLVNGKYQLYYSGLNATGGVAQSGLLELTPSMARVPARIMGRAEGNYPFVELLNSLGGMANATVSAKSTSSGVELLFGSNVSFDAAGNYQLHEALKDAAGVKITPAGIFSVSWDGAVFTDTPLGADALKTLTLLNDTHGEIVRLGRSAYPAGDAAVVTFNTYGDDTGAGHTGGSVFLGVNSKWDSSGNLSRFNGSRGAWGLTLSNRLTQDFFSVSRTDSAGAETTVLRARGAASVVETPYDVMVTNSAKGIILKSPDGTCYRFTVANGGALSAGASVTCP